MTKIVQLFKNLVLPKIYAAENWSTGADEPAKLKDLVVVFDRILSKALIPLAGLVTFAYIIIGGFKYITAGGDEKAVEKAKKTITYAFIGLLVAVCAWLFINTLDQSLKGINLLEI
ncbi:MAG: pilin [Patescibacteria group bacterium]